MKRNRIFLIVTVLSLAFALAAMAQAPGRMGGQGMRGAGQGQPALGQGPFGSPQWLATYLGLTEAQIAQWQGIRDAAQAQVAPLNEQRRANVEQLRTLLESEAPSPAAVGALVIANHDLGQDIREIHENAQKQFVNTVLTPEQKLKYEQWLEFRKSMPRRGPGGQGEGAGAGFGAGMGFGQGGGFGDGTCPCCED